MQDPMPLKPSNTRSTGSQGMTVLTSALLRDFNQPEPGLCQPCPNSRLHAPLLKPLHEHAYILSIKIPHFCFWGCTALGKIPKLIPVALGLGGCRDLLLGFAFPFGTGVPHSWVPGETPLSFLFLPTVRIFILLEIFLIFHLC